jgi:hypothetical protein
MCNWNHLVFIPRTQGSLLGIVVMMHWTRRVTLKIQHGFLGLTLVVRENEVE